MVQIVAAVVLESLWNVEIFRLMQLRVPLKHQSDSIGLAGWAMLQLAHDFQLRLRFDLVLATVDLLVPLGLDQDPWLLLDLEPSFGLVLACPI